MGIQQEMVLTFGTGDIIVSLVKFGDLVDTLGFLETDKPLPIGCDLRGEMVLERTDLAMMLRFTDPASVDVVMEALTLVKDNLLEARDNG